MTEEVAVRFPIRFEATYGALSTMLFLAPADSYVDVLDDAIEVRMAWAFRARFPKDSVRHAAPGAHVPLTRGVHGWAGRWLVNGSGDGILTLDLAPTQRARVMGFPVKLKQLMVSVDEPDVVAAKLRG
ncbi:MAG: hypothetical protein JST54_10230 [Deltaproteobacteria bacterium]|nr:hypothetical protein [Deltaproteobacteria bacterium]